MAHGVSGALWESEGMLANTSRCQGLAKTKAHETRQQLQGCQNVPKGSGYIVRALCRGGGLHVYEAHRSMTPTHQTRRLHRIRVGYAPAQVCPQRWSTPSGSSSGRSVWWPASSATTYNRKWGRFGFLRRPSLLGLQCPQSYRPSLTWAIGVVNS